MTDITPRESRQPTPVGADPVARRAPVLLVLGNDAVLAARPASAVQLAHAGLRAGFDLVVPASWGEELVAAACARQLGKAPTRSAIFCACPHVGQRLLAVGPELAPYLASYLAPPAALAQHLRALYAPHPVRVTYVGRCAGASTEFFDAVIAPVEFLGLLADRQIVPAAQPEAFESVLPPDRRRFHSLPGGLPAVTALRDAGAPHAIVELSAEDVAAEVAQHLLGATPVLIDAAARLGCACVGAGPGCGDDPRAAVAALEPPPALAPVVEPTDRPVTLSVHMPAAPRSAADVVAALARRAGPTRSGPEPAHEAPPQLPESPPHPLQRSISIVAEAFAQRLSPQTPMAAVRHTPPSTPAMRAHDGRVLPRAYVAQRRRGHRSDPPDGSAVGWAVDQEPIDIPN